MPDFQVNEYQLIGILNGSFAGSKKVEDMQTTETRAVIEQEAEANRMIEQLAAQNGNTDNPAPEIQNEEPKKDDKEEQKLEPVVEQDKPVDYEQRYKVLQGKYNAEIPQLRQQVSSLQSQLANLKQQETSDEPKAQNVQQAMANLKEEWGNDFVSHISSIVQSEVAKTNSRVEAMETNHAKSSTEQKFQGLRNILSPMNIDFDGLENNPDFATWLHQIDEMSGQPRQNLLMSAFNSGDLQRASIFYKQFSASNSSTELEQSNQPAKNPLEDHIQIKTRSSGDEPAQEEVWTQASIKRFYEDCAAGRLTQEEMDNYERQIFRATSAGRVATSNFNT